MDPPSTTRGGRGRRVIRKSQRATQTGKSIPDINSALNFSPSTKDSTLVSHDTPVPSIELGQMAPMIDPKSEAAAGLLKQTKKTTNKKKSKVPTAAGATSGEPAAASGLAALARGGKHPIQGTGLGKDMAAVNAVQKPPPQKKKKPPGRKPNAQQKPPSQLQPPPTNSPYGSGKLLIYNWELPSPTDFLHLRNTRKAWKAEADEEEQENDTDPELDDWDEFSAVPYRLFADITAGYSVARTFVKRAKRALWAGKSWVDFENEELKIDSMAHAGAVEDPSARAICLEEALNNEFRLNVFDQVKVRLCQEIWLEGYHVRGKAGAAQGKGEKKDSIVEPVEVSGATSLHFGGATADVEMADAASVPKPGSALAARLDKMEASDQRYQQNMQAVQAMASTTQTLSEIQQLMASSDEEGDEEDQKHYASE